MQDKGVGLSYTPAALKLLCEKASGGKFGARDLRRVIRKEVEDPIAERIVSGDAPREICIDAENGALHVTGEQIAVAGMPLDSAAPKTV